MSDMHLALLSDERRLAAIATDLRGFVRGDVRFGRHDRMLFATDASIYQVEPLGVVAPRDLEEAQQVVEYCARHGLPILPRGGGTSLAGQAVNRAIVLDFSRYCNRIIEIDAAAKTARVEPGVVLAHLNQTLGRKGLMFGPDVATASHANVGGMIGNNSAGARSVLYGRTVEHLLGLDVVLADGSRIRLEEGAAKRDRRIAAFTHQVADIVFPLAPFIETRFPKILRHVDGYNLDIVLKQLRAPSGSSSSGSHEKVNLAHLFCGSEGTLGVTVEAKLNLVEAPKCKGLVVVVFAGVDEALVAVQDVLATQPSAVELIDDVVLGLAMQNSECKRYVEMMPRDADNSIGALLYIEYFADSECELAKKFVEIERTFSMRATKRFTSGPEMAMAWKLRAAGEPLLHGLPGKRKPITFVEDAAVDPKHVAEFIPEFRAIVERHGTTAAYYAHASVGCLHVRPLVNLRDEDDRQIIQQIAEDVAELAMRYGGALSGEHGDGRLRSHLLERFYGREICEGFRQIKAVFDNQNLMNPRIIVDPSPMLESLRVKPRDHYIPQPERTRTYFRYEREHGFSEAIEMCNGAGVCRKMMGGTMCPSYRATLDERHATRGRGNALRLAMTGQLSNNDGPAWNDSDTLETLDLCLSCKACKSECPSNVDLAKLKAEYIAHTWEARGGPPLATRLIGNLRTFNRIGSVLHPIANALMNVAPTRALINHVGEFDARRSLPRFAKSLYRQPGGSRNRAGRRSDGEIHGTVILFPDCFTAYNEPRIGLAAIETLQMMGYRVVLPKMGCCGRTQISVGLLRQAQRTCAATAQALIECMDRENGVAVVGCEPSCVSAIVDDWQDLEMNVDRTALAAIKERTFTVEDFLATQMPKWQSVASQRDSEAQDTSSASEVLLHGHCHQKALWGTDRTEKLLSDLIGDRLTLLDSGCCGMAGSFGYTSSHYDLSQRIGELALFPALRANPNALILAPGTSCRHQIRDALNREAMHPIEFLRDHLDLGE